MLEEALLQIKEHCLNIEPGLTERTEDEDEDVDGLEQGRGDWEKELEERSMHAYT